MPMTSYIRYILVNTVWGGRGSPGKVGGHYLRDCVSVYGHLIWHDPEHRNLISHLAFSISVLASHWEKMAGTLQVGGEEWHRSLRISSNLLAFLPQSGKKISAY